MYSSMAYFLDLFILLEGTKSENPSRDEELEVDGFFKRFAVSSNFLVLCKF